MDTGTSTPPVDTPPPASPIEAPPVITHNVFESKPGRAMKPARQITIRTWLATAAVLFFVIITIFYFWGAFLVQKGLG